MSKILSKFGWVLLLILIVASILAAWLGLKITHIKCTVNSQPCDATQIVRFNSVLGQSLLFFNDQKLKASTRTDSQFQLETVGFELPNTIVLSLSHQVLAYRLASDTQSETLMIATTGQVMTATDQQVVTTIYLNPTTWDQIKIANEVNTQFHQQLLDILATLQTNKQPATFLTWVDSQTLAIDNPGQPQVILDPSNLRTDLARLKVTQQALQNQPVTSPTTALSPSSEIDVRFQLPVLRTSPTIPRHGTQ